MSSTILEKTEITLGEIWAQPFPCFSYIEELNGKWGLRVLIPLLDLLKSVIIAKNGSLNNT